MKYYIAIDIGASSGRHIVGWEENGEFKTDEVYRFHNGVKEENGHLIWDISALLESVKAGIDEALKKYPKIESLSIDTWGCDYVLMKGQKEVLPVYAYRDSRTAEAIQKVHEIVPFEELYARTGIQFQLFNTIYQLYADMLNGRLNGVTDFLMIPEYLMYKLTSVKCKEYTNATTTGLVNAKTKQYDTYITSKLGLPESLFPSLKQPQTVVGEYKGIKVVLCATHDTASAVEGIPMSEENSPYISSGTWSLLGIKTPAANTAGESRKGNWSNEGGVGYIRYQKNIMGMWVVNRLKDELCPEKPFKEIDDEAEKSTFYDYLDVNDSAFLSPKSMKEAFDEWFEREEKKPVTVGDYFRCAYTSLAISYMNALQELECNTGKTYRKLYIVGGGAKNKLLNDLTKETTKKEVIALPIEATALGNLKQQMEI